MFPPLSAVRGFSSGLTPNVYIYNDVIGDIEVLMNHAASFSTPCEVQWYLTCRREVTGKNVNYILDELTVPPQQVQPAFVETTAAEQAEYNRDLQMRYGCQRAGASETPGLIRVRRYLNMRSPKNVDIIEEDITGQEFGERMNAYQAFKNRSTIWCHSHVNMATNPSGTDDTQWKEWLTGFLSLDNNPTNAGQRPDAVGMFIFNLSGQYFNRIKDNVFGVEHECVPLTVITRNEFPEGFLASYVAKKPAPVAVIGGSTSKSYGYGTGNSTNSNNTYPSYTHTIKNPFAIVASHYLNSPISTAPKTADDILTTMKKRAQTFFDMTLKVYEKTLVPKKGEFASFFKDRASYVCYPMSKTVQDDIRYYWERYNDACFGTVNSTSYILRRQYAAEIFMAIGDYLALPDSEELIKKWSATAQLGSDVTQIEFYKSLNESYILSILAFKLAAYITHLQWGQAADYTFENSLITLLFDKDGDFNLFAEKDSLAFKTGVTENDYNTIRHTISTKVVSYEALIWSLAQIERFRYGSNHIPDYRKVFRESLVHFRTRSTEMPPFLLSDLGIAAPKTDGDILSSGPRLVGSSESTALVKQEPEFSGSDKKDLSYYDYWNGED